MQWVRQAPQAGATTRKAGPNTSANQLRARTPSPTWLVDQSRSHDPEDRLSLW
jgi:hypothetical protein